MLFNGDCLEVMKTLEDKSIDLVFCDLPYGQTSCKWDCKIDLVEFWKQIMRIKKLNTPLFFTTTTKFGVELINSAPKKCFFRYDLVWVKSAPAGFLTAKKMPMRKHEMVYVFYEKLPFYDLSRHTHKFIKTKPREKEDLYGMKGHADGKEGKYDPPLPVSVIKKVKRDSTYGKIETHDLKTGKNNGVARYDPPLPVSVVKEETGGATGMTKDFTPNKNGNIYDCPDNQEFEGRNGKPRYDPPLPVSVVKEEENNTNKNSELYGKIKGNGYSSEERKGAVFDPPLPVSVLKEEEKQDNNKDFSVEVKNSTYGTLQIKQPITSGARWEPPLPVSVVKEEDKGCYGEKVSNSEAKYGQKCAQQYDPPLPVSVVKVEIMNSELYGELPKTENFGKSIGMSPSESQGQPRYDPPLPVSVVKQGDITITELEPEPEPEDTNKDSTMINGTLGGAYDSRWQKGHQGNSYDPPLPNTLLEIKSTRGKHSTEKPVALMEWVLSYYSKEGDIILDPTMGSGSTGVACKNLNRKFIGIEMDAEIFEVAKSRNPDELIKG